MQAVSYSGYWFCSEWVGDTAAATRLTGRHCPPPPPRPAAPPPPPPSGPAINKGDSFTSVRLINSSHLKTNTCWHARAITVCCVWHLLVKVRSWRGEKKTQKTPQDERSPRGFANSPCPYFNFPPSYLRFRPSCAAPRSRNHHHTPPPPPTSPETCLKSAATRQTKHLGLALQNVWLAELCVSARAGLCALLGHFACNLIRAHKPK